MDNQNLGQPGNQGVKLPPRTSFYKGLVIGLVIGAVFTAGLIGYLYKKKHPFPDPYSCDFPPCDGSKLPKAPAPITDNQTAGWKTYTSNMGFELKYPDNYWAGEGEFDFSLYIPPQIYLVTPAQPIFAVAIPQNSYPKTDFQGGFITINYANNLTAASCQQWLTDNPKEKNLTEKVVINGITFYKGEDDGAAAGHQSADEFYHTFYNNLCYEIVLGVRTGGYGAIDGITHVDYKTVLKELEKILNTFKFTNQDETADWKIYKNEKYGFEIKYPRDYSVKEYGANNFSIYSSADTNRPSLVYLNWGDTNKTLDEIINEKTGSISISEATPVILNGVSAYEAVDLGMYSSYAVFFKNDTGLIEINFTSGNDNGLAKNKAALTGIQKLILS